MLNRKFWERKSVFITGHTGFKGGWMSAWLVELGARVSGYSLPPDTRPCFFELCGIAGRVESRFGDIRDSKTLGRAVREAEPEIVFHLAAQPLVRRSYQAPLDTLATNVMGTAHVLEAARCAPAVRAVVVVTSDKCYLNRGLPRGYREDDPMGGRDPYSASKGCAELVTAAYRQSFFQTGKAAVATARAGNVIGGGDWAEDRILPDAVRAFGQGKPLGVRNPDAVRPWQHVLEPLAGYLMLAGRLCVEGDRWAGGWNFGPDESGAAPVSALADLIVRHWGQNAAWLDAREPGARHEESYLMLDSGKAREMLGWRPRLNLSEAVEWTAAWYKQALTGAGGDSMYEFTRRQIRCYEERESPAASRG
ncbi:MAG: CDP-glucose 4,6-dehydratase [Bryobacterales bacterium]|nr:CDP-glucose 4,6-dehydratase [Bryobacterales bacterium]